MSSSTSVLLADGMGDLVVVTQYRSLTTLDFNVISPNL